MHKISLDSIEKAAKRIAVRHFFSNVGGQQTIDRIWEWTTLDGDEATRAYKFELCVAVWQPFEYFEITEVLDNMIVLYNSIVEEMTEELE